MGMVKDTLQEFKDYIMKGNIFDMSVGVVIGGSVSNVVNSMIKDVITPLLKLPSGNVNVSDLLTSLGENIFQLLVVSFGVFMVVKAMNKVTSIVQKSAEEPVPATKICPYCKSEIPIDAVKCRFCASSLEEEPVDAPAAVLSQSEA